jgi:4-hydroxy-3-polyprenylbenzoate decarboxylase
MKGKSTLFVVSVIILALSFCPLSVSAEEPKPTGPYDTLRDYVAALDAKGRLLRIKEVDQDKYEATAFVYRMVDKLGADRAPTVWFEKLRINGKWIEGPVLGNLYCGWDSAAMIFGVEKITDDQGDMYRAVVDKLTSHVDEKGQWKKIDPVVVDKSSAPCKEVILTGDDVDILKFPWLKNNPGDVGQYVQTGAVIMEDPELGRNVGTYHCQIKGKTKIGVNPEPGQHGWHFMMRAKSRGERVVKAAVALGVDPLTYSMSCTKVAGLGEDELAFAGGLRGKPVEVVKCETSDILVPAQAEMIIEGEIPVEMEEEGPKCEMLGYLGKKHRNFYMNVKAITHRKKPLFYNCFIGATKMTHMIPWEIGAQLELKKMLPGLVGMYSPREATGITIVSIDKRFPGEGIATGQLVAGARFFGTTKIVIVVDKDIDPTNIIQVLHAVATRWQPHPASLIVPQTRGMLLDPSQKHRGVTSKIIIDATQQLPNEGGPESWPPASRVLLQEKAPESFELVDNKWPEYWKEWKK